MVLLAYLCQALQVLAGAFYPALLQFSTTTDWNYQVCGGWQAGLPAWLLGSERASWHHWFVRWLTCSLAHALTPLLVRSIWQLGAPKPLSFNPSPAQHPHPLSASLPPHTRSHSHVMYPQRASSTSCCSCCCCYPTIPLSYFCSHTTPRVVVGCLYSVCPSPLGFLMCDYEQRLRPKVGPVGHAKATNTHCQHANATLSRSCGMSTFGKMFSVNAGRP